MNIKLVLVEHEDASDIKVYASSGILLNNKYVLITSSILRNLYKNENTKTELNQLAVGKLHFNVLQNKNLRLNVIQKNKDNLYTLNHAKIFATYICKNIKTSTKLLSDWAVDYKSNLGYLNEILPYFFVLSISDSKEISARDLHETLMEWFNKINTNKLTKGDSLFINSVPFGYRSFLNSYSKGIISNIFGENSCLVLSDCSSTPGSEGSPAYHINRFNEEVPVGLVISSLNWWRGEWIGLTLIANIKPLLVEILNLNYNNNPNMYSYNAEITNSEILAAVENSLVQVYCGNNSWGTGIVLLKEKGLILTNSHVIENDDDIKIYLKNKCIKSKLLYKTQNGTVYDIALIKCDPDQLAKCSVTNIIFISEPLKTREEVFCAGYSLFKKDTKISPSISKGHISQYDRSMLKTSCCVLPGASGGAVLNCEGKLVGIIVCNTKVDETAYSRFNMAIPVVVIQDALKAYIASDDLNHLKKLHVTDPDLVKLWTCLESKL